MSTLFFYGTLCHAPLLELVLARDTAVDLVPGVLPGHRVHWVQGHNFPIIVADAGGQAQGVLARGLSAQDVARLDFYEGGFAYDLRELSIETEAGVETAQVYFARDGIWHPGAAWDLSDWARDWGALVVTAAAEYMQYFGKLTADQVAKRFGAIQARAHARLMAAQAQPGGLRAGYSRADVSIEAATRPYSEFFALDEMTLRYRRFDGGWSDPLRRAAFVACDAVTVLPYDPVRDRVMLVEQFRMGAFARGDAYPWVLEPIAGRCDPGETTEQTARREAREEAGIELGQLERIGGYYPSPGALTEYLTSYVALADLPEDVAGLGGEEAEGEDIRAHLLGFEALMALVARNEAENGPLLISALWLAQNRARLRALA